MSHSETNLPPRMKKRIILFNGPPRSGKDTAADCIYSNNPMIHWFRLSAPLKAMVLALFGYDSTVMQFIEAHKDERLSQLEGFIYRELQIWLSEDCIKPKFGPDIFGKIAAHRVDRAYSLLHMCSDAGFAEEVVPLVNLVGADNVLIVQIHRDGCNFDNDSRSYITVPGVRTIKLMNEGKLVDYQYAVKAVVNAWLDQSES